MRYGSCVIAVAVAAFWAIAPTAIAQQDSSTQQATSANPASNPDQELGRRFLIKAENLPSPKSDPVAASRSLLIPYTGQVPRAMEGFTATPFVTGLEHPRRLLVLPNNDVIVAEQKTGHLTLLRDEDGDGKADYIERYADDFKAPYGLAYRDGFVLVADQEGIWRVPHVSGALRAGRPDQPKAPTKRGPPEVIVRDIANKFPEWGGSPCSFHIDLVIGDLLGQHVGLKYQIPRPGGRRVKSGTVFDPTPEEQAFHRWHKGEFQEVERLAA